MDLSLCLDTGRPWDDLAALARAADRSGVHTVYVSDHLMPFGPVGQAAEAPVLEAWTTLTALAAVTERSRLGTLVLGGTLRHPAMVAKMATTLDHVSAGRLVLGLGAGWQANEHAATGIPLPPVTERLDRFAESLAAVTLLLHEGGGSLSGRYVRLTGAACRPRPVQERLPVLVGGSGERRTLRIAATYADAWHTWGAADEFRRLSGVLDQHCAAVGRDPSSIRRVTGGIPDEPEELLGYVAAGADEYVLRDHRDEPVSTTLARLAALVGA
jgi:F420-dependent oxidoreductase-like protein